MPAVAENHHSTGTGRGGDVTGFTEDIRLHCHLSSTPNYKRKQNGAKGGIRTRIPLRGLDPKSSASASSATLAPFASALLTAYCVSVFNAFDF